MDVSNINQKKSKNNIEDNIKFLNYNDNDYNQNPPKDYIKKENSRSKLKNLKSKANSDLITSINTNKENNFNKNNNLNKTLKNEEKDDHLNIENKDIYNYTKYEEIPPSKNFEMIGYFNKFISNKIASGSLLDKKAKLRKIAKMQFEIVSKSFSEFENNENCLYNNQNKLKNKISYKLLGMNKDRKVLNNDENYNSSVKPSFSDFNDESEISLKNDNSQIKETENSNLNMNFNEEIKYKQPIGSLRFENQMGKGDEENFVDLKKINDIIKFKNNKILNSNEIKNRINKTGVVKDFENLQNLYKMNYIKSQGIEMNNDSTNPSHFNDDNKIDTYDQNQIQFKKNINKDPNVQKSNVDIDPKKNLIVLKMIRNNTKNEDSGIKNY